MSLLRFERNGEGYVVGFLQNKKHEMIMKMTEQEKDVLEATKEFAAINFLPYDNKIESMILNAMREAVKNCHIANVVERSEQLNCDHEWKVDTFDCYGFPIEQYCDKCDKKEAI